MVLRPSSSNWSVAPETIMSHHYKLNRGVKSVIDTSPPFSMYNSPISVHYIPKRASSADAAKRRQPKVPRPHRELAEYVGASQGRLPPALRLPLNGIDVKPRLLQSKDYQPPLHRKKLPPPLPPPKGNSWKNADRKHENGQLHTKENFLFDLFKDCVYSYVIDREVFTDGIINEAVDVAMEQWSDQISWEDLEYLREEIFDELGVQTEHFTAKSIKLARKDPIAKERLSTSSGSRSVTSSSSASSLSELKSRSGSRPTFHQQSSRDLDGVVAEG
ncbi:hypothetical protein GCK32_014286 [Trichostrongylus colubriformis]|uniref:Uncharacterized protein n=1 Tax=Trichostrongylus colubriformis TaxID=6319 RepID=A0AAN8GDK8_TRICO